MYRAFRDWALRIMKAPTEPPEPPAGSHDSVEVYRASPKYLSYRLLGYWIAFGITWAAWLAMFIGGLAEEESFAIIAALLLPILVLVQLFGYIAVRVDYDMRYYIITDRSMRVREGAIVVREQTITYANVQNLRVIQGPLLRLFGIWNLRADTAGGGGTAAEQKWGLGGHVVEMAGIENAHDVRDQILAHLRVHGGGTGLGDPDDEQGALPRDVIDALREVSSSAAALRSAAEAASSRERY